MRTNTFSSIKQKEFHFTPCKSKRSKGFTLIELMIVIAVIAIILTLAIPTYSNYLIRSKIGEALSVSKAAKTAVAATCQEDLAIQALTPTIAGYQFTSTEYVDNIDINGPCAAPNIVVTTRNTGATTDPVITITGELVDGTGRTSWVCVSTGPNIHVPEVCRS